MYGGSGTDEVLSSSQYCWLQWWKLGRPRNVLQLNLDATLVLL